MIVHQFPILSRQEPNCILGTGPMTFSLNRLYPSAPGHSVAAAHGHTFLLGYLQCGLRLEPLSPVQGGQLCGLPAILCWEAATLCREWELNSTLCASPSSAGSLSMELELPQKSMKSTFSTYRPPAGKTFSVFTTLYCLGEMTPLCIHSWLVVPPSSVTGTALASLSSPGKVCQAVSSCLRGGPHKGLGLGVCSFPRTCLSPVIAKVRTGCGVCLGV